MNNLPLISYSISFAKTIKYVDKIICSTDSKKYASISQSLGAEAPFLRSKEASQDNSMEPEVLRDLRSSFKKHDIEEPDIVIWLRPTFPFRRIEDIMKCVKFLIENQEYSCARTVCSAESRLYKIVDNQLLPNYDDKEKSMVRRQDMIPCFKVFSADVFWFKYNEFNDDFLGQKTYPVIIDKISGIDIDDELDFQIAESIIESKKINLKNMSISKEIIDLVEINLPRILDGRSKR